MDRRVVFLDIDGTLTAPGSNEPPESAVWAISEARKRGHYVFLCTGRNNRMLSPFLKYGFDGVVACCGGYIRCFEDVIYNCPLTAAQRMTAMEVLKKNGIYRTLECLDNSYADEGFKEFVKNSSAEGSNSELLRWREQIDKELSILPMREYQGQPAYKFVMMSKSLEPIERAQKILSDDFNFCIQDTNLHGFVNGEAVNKKYDKGRAVERVCEHLHIPLKHSIGIGDSMNDKEMLETVGVSICMENGSEEMKRLADEVCPSVWEDGIREAFRKHQLI